MSVVRDWWLDNRKCCCGHARSPHRHYRSRSNRLYLECSTCDPGVCEHFQWRLLKWVY